MFQNSLQMYFLRITPVELVTVCLKVVIPKRLQPDVLTLTLTSFVYDQCVSSSTVSLKQTPSTANNSHNVQTKEGTAGSSWGSITT